MSLYFVWDATYESLPGSSLPRNLIANEIRNMKLGIRGMMEAQHNFGFNTPKDDGSHWGGHVTVALAGTTPPATTFVNEGALFINNTAVVYAMLYHSGGWISASSSLDHNQLTNRTLVTDHNQYLAATGGADTTGYAMKMGGNFIYAVGAAQTNTFGQVLLFGHRHTGHPSWGSTSGTSGWLTKHNAFVSGLKSGSFQIVQSSIAGTIPAGSSVTVPMVNNSFVPKILATTTGVKISFVNSTNSLVLINGGGAAVSYRVEFEYIQAS